MNYSSPTAIILSSLFVCIAGFSFTQLNLNGITLTNSGFGYFDPAQINVACSSPVTLGVGTAGNYELISGEKIQFCPGFKVSSAAGSTGHFQARIANQQLDAVMLEPTTGSIGKYEKVEFGINLPQLDTRINTFLNDVTGNYKPTTATYDAALANGTIINPYDPAHISVDAVFFRPSSPHSSGVIKHGFFYKQFNDDDTGPEPDWAFDATNPYEWRLRFSPDELGEWNGYITVWINGVPMSENFFFSFKVIASEKHGFINVAANNRYLQYDDGEQFFPVGDNAPFATQLYTSGDNCLTENCSFPADHRIKRGYRDDYVEYLDDLSDNGSGEGGNFTRLIMAPWGLEIEYDRLNNYDSRQIEMSELDNIFENAEEREVGLIMTTLLHGTVKPDPDSYLFAYGYSENWEWNPYNDGPGHDSVPDPNEQYKGISGLTSNFDFFSNATAKKLYKHKLRYISARWGYSTSFMVHELMSEVDQYPGFWDVAGHSAVAENWLEEMAAFIQEELGDRQLTTVSYTGGYHTPEAGAWSKPHIDLISGHNYLPRLDGLRIKANQTNSVQFFYNKPAINNENDIDATSVVCACDNTFLHQNLWASALSGSFGAGMSWELARYTHDEWHDGPGMDVEKEYVGVRRFFENIDLVNYDYGPYNSVKVPSTPSSDNDNMYSGFENLYLARDDKNALYGWFHNRSINYLTHQGECDVIDTDNSNEYVQPYETMYELIQNEPTIQSALNLTTDPLLSSSQMYTFFYPMDETNLSNPYPEYPVSTGTFYLKGLLPSTSYNIEYYDTQGANTGVHNTAYDYTFTTNTHGGYLVSNAPPTGGSYSGDWAYIVSRDYMRRTTTATPETESGEHLFTIFPNPSTGVFTLESTLLSEITSIKVMDAYGRTAIKLKNTSAETKRALDLTACADGLYYVEVTIGDTVFIRKIIKE